MRSLKLARENVLHSSIMHNRAHQNKTNRTHASTSVGLRHLKSVHEVVTNLYIRTLDNYSNYYDLNGPCIRRSRGRCLRNSE